MSKPPRIDRKTLKTPDQFVKKGQLFVGFLASQQSRFLPILILGLLILLGVYGFDWWSGKKLTNGWVTYQEAMRAPEAERTEKLKKVFETTRLSRPSLFAAVNVADHYFDEAKKDLLKAPSAPSANATQAVEWYNKALEHKDLLVAEKQLLLVNRGGAQEMQQKLDDALVSYREAADLTGDGKGLAMLHVGRALELKREPAKAIETYEKVSADFNNTEYAKVAKNNLRRMKSPNFSATPKS